MTVLDGALQDLNDLYFFAAVVEHGGFSSAGRALGIPKSRLSKRIAQLEERLGVRLLQRTTRRFVVTEVGERFYGHCRAVLEEARAAQEAVEEVTVAATDPLNLVGLLTPGPRVPAVAGHSLVYRDGAPAVLEVNSMPAWSGLQTVSACNIAEAIAQALMDELNCRPGERRIQ